MLLCAYVVKKIRLVTTLLRYQYFIEKLHNNKKTVVQKCFCATVLKIFFSLVMNLDSKNYFFMF